MGGGVGHKTMEPVLLEASPLPLKFRVTLKVGTGNGKCEMG